MDGFSWLGGLRGDLEGGSVPDLHQSIAPLEATGLNVFNSGVVDALLGVVIHPRVAATRATTARLRLACLHLDELTRGGNALENVSRSVVDFVVSAEIAGVVKRHAVELFLGFELPNILR